MSFLYEYMTEDELYMESLIATSRSNLEKLNSKFDKLMLEHKLNILRIDSKIVMESGTINDLETLYLAEAEEVKKESKGILGSIIEQVKKFFRKLKDILFGKKIDEEKLPEQVELPCDPNAVEKEANSLIARYKQLSTGKKIGLGVKIGIGGFIAKKVLKKELKPIKEKLQNVVNNISSAINSNVNTNDPESQKECKTILNRLHSIGEVISRSINKITSGSTVANDSDGNPVDTPVVPESNRSNSENFDDITNKINYLKEELKKVDKQLLFANKKQGIISKVMPGGKKFEELQQLSSKNKKNKLTSEERARYNQLSEELKDSKHVKSNSTVNELIQKKESLQSQISDLMKDRDRVNKAINKENKKKK